MKAKNIFKSDFKRLMCIYTKCNKLKGESYKKGNYRQIWGVLESETKLKIHLFSVIRDGCISDRSKAFLSKIININPNTKLSIIGGKVIINN